MAGRPGRQTEVNSAENCRYSQGCFLRQAFFRRRQASRHLTGKHHLSCR